MFDVLALGGWPLLVSAFVLGALIGSFLNVVILRLPKMMTLEWQDECASLAGREPEQREPFNLIVPASHCPACGHKIRFWENLPIVGFWLLGGKCTSCSTPLSHQYWFVELATALLSLFLVSHFGWTAQALAGLFLLWGLIALAVIDYQTQLLPDRITLPLLWLGLLINTQGIFTDLSSAVYGAVFGYLALWSVFQIFRLITGKEGMGFGDFKLLSLLGAWLGWQLLPQIVLFSSLIGALVGGILLVSQKLQAGKPIPFGPYLVLAALIALFWGSEINEQYLRFSGLG